MPLGAGVNINNIGFHAPPQEPGWADDGTFNNQGYSSTPWQVTQASDSIIWNCETFAQNRNANAIRFGTLYNFRFDADQPPQSANATVGFFKTGSSITVAIQAPGSGATPTPTSTPTPTPTASGCSVTTSCPSVIFSQPTDFIIDLSDPANPATVHANALTVNGTPANSFALSNGNTTIIFHFNTSPVVPGQNTMHIAACAFDCGSGCVQEFTCTFTYKPSTPTPTPTATPTSTPKPSPTPRLRPSPPPRP